MFGLTPNTPYNFQVIGFRGTLNVNAVFGGLSNVASGTTTLTAVATVVVTPSTAMTNVGSGGVQFTAVTKDAGGNVLSGRTVTWGSSNNGIATVSGTGLASGVATGSATITATSGAASGTASLTVAALSPGSVSNLNVLAVSDTSATLSFTQVSDGLGGAASYDVHVSPAPITFGSAPSVTRGTCATPLAGTSVGSTLTCTVFGLTANTAYTVPVIAYRGTLNVNAVFGLVSNVTAASTTLTPVASVTVAPGVAMTNIGSGGVQFTATLKDAGGNVLSGRTVTWNSSATGVATVSATGLASGVSAGPATITATSGAASGTATLTVAAPPTPPGTVTDLHVVTINDTSATLGFTQVGDGLGGAASYDVRFAISPIAWGSATSTASGTCTTPVAGTAAGAALTCTVRGLTPSTNYNFELIAFRGTLNVNAIFGGLSNVAAGTTTLTPAASVTVAPTVATTNVGSGGVQFTATVKDAGGNVLAGRSVTWTSSNNAFATISGTGLATGVAAGTTTITATSGAASGAASLTVTTVTPGAVTDLERPDDERHDGDAHLHASR